MTRAEIKQLANEQRIRELDMAISAQRHHVAEAARVLTRAIQERWSMAGVSAAGNDIALKLRQLAEIECERDKRRLAAGALGGQERPKAARCGQ